MTRFHDPSLFAQAPNAVLFDVDNTMYAYDPLHAAGMAAVQAKVTRMLSVNEARFQAAFAEAREQIKERLHGSAASHNRLLYFQRMCEILGLGSQVLLALDLEQTYWRTFLGAAELFDGLRDFLDDLRLAGIPIAIVTDLTAQIQMRKIVYFGLDHFFDHIVTSEEAGFDKPHAAPFQLALAKAKPQGGRVWMIGDSARADIEGARKAIGAATLQKLHKGVVEGTGEQRPDATFQGFGELRELLARTLAAKARATASA